MADDHRELVIWLEHSGAEAKDESWYQAQANSLAMDAGQADPLVIWLRDAHRSPQSTEWFTAQANAARAIMLAICAYNQAERSYSNDCASNMNFSHFHSPPALQLPDPRRR